jgi:hypothetical protein
MSATPTTNVFRGGAITHLPVGSINQGAPLTRRGAKALDSAVKVSGHGTLVTNSLVSISQRRRIGGSSRLEADPHFYRPAAGNT